VSAAGVERSGLHLDAVGKVGGPADGLKAGHRFHAPHVATHLRRADLVARRHHHLPFGLERERERPEARGAALHDDQAIAAALHYPARHEVRHELLHVLEVGEHFPRDVERHRSVKRCLDEERLAVAQHVDDRLAARHPRYLGSEAAAGQLYLRMESDSRTARRSLPVFSARVRCR
jgi:hypothetical protein